MPGVQKPHCVPPCSTSACCSGCSSPPADKPLDGGDVAARRLQRQHQAGIDRRAVHQHRAGAAVAVAAAFLGAGQAEPVAQQVEQRVARVGEHAALLAVDGAGRAASSCDRDLDIELPAAVGERARRQHGHQRAAIVGRAARIGDRARILRGEPAGLLEQRAASASRRPAFAPPTARGSASAPTEASTTRASAMAPSALEPQPRAGAGDGDVHLAPRREAQVGRRRARLPAAAAGSRPAARRLPASSGPARANIASTGHLARAVGARRSRPARSWQISAGTPSADGAALQMLPPRLARFCTCTPPISCADWATAG